MTCGIVHHNLALFKAPKGAQLPQQGQISLNHFAFKVQSYQALQEAHKRLVGAGATIDRIVDHGTTRSVYLLDPDGLRMELFCDAFATNEEGLAFIKASPGRVTPLNITTPEPPKPAMPQAE